MDNLAHAPKPPSQRPGTQASARPAVVPEFTPGGDFTVGVEEELMLVDSAGELLGAAGASLVDSLSGVTPLDGRVTREIYADQVELNSPACVSAEDVVRSLSRLRARITDRGIRAMAIGVHPSAPVGTAVITPSPRYAAIADEYAGLLRTPTAALQVHVGVSDTETAMRVYRCLRPRLSLLSALAASTPYWHGLDSGLASARWAILRSYPRTTGAPLLRSWDEYVARTEQLMAAAEVPDHTYVWWDLRPRPELGTLEVRVMDAQASLSRVAGLTALVQGIARRAVVASDTEELSDDVIAVNGQRVMRHGLDARIVDVDATIRPVREIGRRTLAQARAVLAPDGLDAAMDVVEEMLGEPGEPARQRRLVESGAVPALLEDLVARTTGAVDRLRDA